MKRLCFLSQVHSAAISAGHVFVFSKRECARLDSQLAKLLRAMLLGKAHKHCEETNRHSTLTNEQVFKHWRITPCRVELPIRRLKMMQKHLGDAKQHTQVNACMFATFPFEDAQLDGSGLPSNRAHPWLRQFYGDLEQLAVTDEGAELLDYLRGRQNISTLLHDSEARDLHPASDHLQASNTFLASKQKLSLSFRYNVRS